MKPSMKDIYSKYVVWDDKNVRGFFGEEYRFLSNFHVCDVWFEGVLYPSSEHAYMASKSLSEGVRTRFAKFPSYPFKDPREERSSFAPTLTPSEARKLGQTIELRPNWENIKYDMMLAIVFDKFWRNKDIQGKLLDTGDKYLEETNHWSDRVWGVDYKTGIGNNWLGEILMRTRECLRK